MPVSINRSTEAALSTLFNTAFMDELHKYLGIDPETPSGDMPVSVSDLFAEAVNTCETEQWRFILPKEVTLLLPKEAFCSWDNLLFLPYGKASSVAITYKNTNSETVSFTDFSMYPGEPIRLYSKNWGDLYNNAYDEPYPVRATYTPGYTTFNEIPKSTVRALKILTYHYFEFRDTLAQSGSDLVPVPAGYEQNRNHAWLANERALRYVTDDPNKVSPR